MAKYPEVEEKLSAPQYQVYKFINPYNQFQGIWLPMWLIEIEDLSWIEKIVYAFLAKYAGNSGCCYPKQETLAQDLNVSLRTIKASLKKLQNYELICSKQTGLNQPNVYFFLEHPKMGNSSELPEVQVSALQGVKSPALQRVIESALPFNRNELKEMNNKPQPQNGCVPGSPNRKKETQIPPSLNTKSFLEVWADFLEHRKQMKKKMSDVAKSGMLKKLSKYSVQTAIQMLDQSIENGWLGVFEIRSQKNSEPEPIYYQKL